MSSLRDKIYNYEEIPPAGTWDKIAIDLDEAELANKFPNQLYVNIIGVHNHLPVPLNR